MSITGHDINSETYKQAMLNANRADKDFVPNYIKNDPEVQQALYLKKLDEQYKKKPK